MLVSLSRLFTSVSCLSVMLVSHITLRQDTDVNKRERLTNITLRQDTDVNKHERPTNITLRQDTDVNKRERLVYLHLYPV
jgi:hypothetical protein